MKQQLEHHLELLRDVEQKLEELSKDKDFKDKKPLEAKEIKGLRLVVSSIIRRMAASN
ncbi:hypothetical protein [Limnobacter sp.]|uniref:hypothetical protein n=1 Tax=Limnobacter sp. TaxID=2003368 RepID=UPI00351939B5